MIRLDLSYFYRLGTHIAGLRTLKYDTPTSEVSATLHSVRAWLVSIEQNDQIFGSGLRGTKQYVPRLRDRIDLLIGRPSDTQFTFYEYMALLGDVNTFEVLLNSELSMGDAYYVLEKKPYSTLTLVTEGERLFPANVLDKVPESYGDLREAGRCLAFEVPTAAAFHIHRATEAVLRRYWHVVTGKQAKPKQRSIGVYLAAMKKLKCGDEKVIAALTQMKDLHRNVIIHPEETLDMNEAIGLVGIANSVVAAMLKEIPDWQPEQPDLLTLPPLDTGGTTSLPS